MTLDAPLLGLVVLSVILGLLVGSFLNVVIHRVPQGLSVVTPPSACPKCGHVLAPYENVPVLAWIALRGRCRRCRAPISIRYPLVELLTAGAFVAIAASSADDIAAAADARALAATVLELCAHLVLAACSIALAAIDLEHHRLPNPIVLTAGITGAILLGAAAALDPTEGLPSLLGALAGAGVLFGVYLALALAWPGGMGLGDVKLAAVIGLFLGWSGWGALAVGGFAAFLLGGIVGVLLLIARRAGARSGIPFGPWMLVGAWIGIAWGEGLFESYLELLGAA